MRTLDCRSEEAPNTSSRPIAMMQHVFIATFSGLHSLGVSHRVIGGDARNRYRRTRSASRKLYEL
jgi:hypothetical protein